MVNKHLVCVLLAAAAIPVIAQDKVVSPVKVCVAQINNQSGSKLDLSKLRQSLLTELQGSKLAKEKAIQFETIEADSSDTAKEMLQKSGCEYAVYTRVLRKPKEALRPGWDNGSTLIVSTQRHQETETYGLQCTVERATTGMPILIDRQFDTQPGAADGSVPKLLTAEAVRIEEALAKKMAK